MNNNDLNIAITASLNRAKTLTQINADVKAIEGQLRHLKLQAGLDKGKSNAEIQKQISELGKQKRQLYLDLKIRKKDLRNEYNSIISQLQSQANPININTDTTTAQNNINSLANTVRTTTSESATLAHKLKDIFDNAGKVISSQTALQLIRKAASEALAAIQEYDEYSKNLKIITNKDNVDNLISDYAVKALDMNVNISEYEKASEVILRAGKNLNESNRYVENAIKLAKTGFIESDTAASNLITVANAYNLTAGELERVNDVLLTLDTSSNTTAGALSEALAKSAKNAQLAGISYDKLGSIIAKLRDSTGKTEIELTNSLNSIFNRTYRVKLGKYILENEDGSTEDITEELSDVEKMLNTLGVPIDAP